MLAMLKPAACDLATRALCAARVTRSARTTRNRLMMVTFHRMLPASRRQAYPLPEIAATPNDLHFCFDFFARHLRRGPLCEMEEPYPRGERASRPLLAITFDDGQRDNFEQAQPRLELRGLRASFVVPVESGCDSRTVDTVRRAGRRFTLGRAQLADRLCGLYPRPR